jgi:SAM-dependent methyltransferase
VVLSDVAPEMTAIAARRVAELELENVSARDLDLEAIDEPDASYDAVLCREGLMLVVDPAQAASEIRRVLRPGGRAAVAVWAERERNPWLGVVFDTVSAQLGAPVPPPGVPQPFSLGEQGSLEAVLSGAGFVDVRVEEVEVPYRGPSFEDWWNRTSALAGPLRNMLAAMSEAALDELKARARAAIAEFETPEGLDIPGVSWLALARA